jgi:hypothetical protein
MTYAEAETERARILAPGYTWFGGILLGGAYECAVSGPKERDAGQLLDEPITSLSYRIEAREALDA